MQSKSKNCLNDCPGVSRVKAYFNVVISTKYDDNNQCHSDVQKHFSYPRSHKKSDTLWSTLGNECKCIIKEIVFHGLFLLC